MTREKMLEKIDNVLLMIDDNIIACGELKEVRQALYEEMIESKCKTSKHSNIANVINKQLKEIDKTCKSKPILANSVIIDYGKEKYLSYTDTFYMIMLKYQDVFTNVINPQEKLLKTITYPNIKVLIPNHHNKFVTSFNKKDLVSKSMLFKQSQKKHTLEYDEATGIMINRNQMLVNINNMYVNASYIIKVCDILGYENITVEYSEDGLKPILLRSKLGFGLVLPLRTIKNI